MRRLRVTGGPRGPEAKTCQSNDTDNELDVIHGVVFYFDPSFFFSFHYEDLGEFTFKLEICSMVPLLNLWVPHSALSRFCLLPYLEFEPVSLPAQCVYNTGAQGGACCDTDTVIDNGVNTDMTILS